MTIIATILREAREAAGLTQTEAATLCGTTYLQWHRWEIGDRSPRNPDALLKALSRKHKKTRRK